MNASHIQNNEEKNKIFISHSSKDKEFVELFVEKILKLALSIPNDRIFCSSIEGSGVKSGNYIPDTIKEEILKSCLAIHIISVNYKQSEICMNEIGATWISLPKDRIIPLLLHDVDFNILGILDTHRLCLKMNDQKDIIKFVQDCKQLLNPSINLEIFYKKVDEFISEYRDLLDKTVVSKNNNTHYDADNSQGNEDDSLEWQNCFTKSLGLFSELLSRTFPIYNIGIHRIENESQQKKLLLGFSKFELTNNFWLKFSGGDYYIEKIQYLPSGNWLITNQNWEIKISDMWISMNSSLDFEFILIKSDALQPFDVQSDARGSSYRVGIMKEGITISDTEVNNGYALINGEAIKLTDDNYEPRYRENKSHWIFFASIYHRIGYNSDEVFDFCKLIDSGDVELNGKNLMKFLRKLSLHPIVSKYK